MADEFDFPDVADWARRNVWGTFAGCVGLLVMIMIGFGAFGYGVIMNEAPVTQASAAVTVPADPMALAYGETLYEVVTNDALSVIAEKNGVTVRMLRERNARTLDEWRGSCVANARKIDVCVDVVVRGGKLVIPATVGRATSSAQ